MVLGLAECWQSITPWGINFLVKQNTKFAMFLFETQTFLKRRIDHDEKSFFINFS